MPTKQRRRKALKPKQTPLKIELKRAIKPLIASLKPTLTALVFLLVSSYAQQFLDKANLTPSCPSTPSQNGKIGVISGIMGVMLTSLDTARDLEGRAVIAGSRSLVITRHAAERMIQRNVTPQMISTALNSGKLFAYAHRMIWVKIGYYDFSSKVFVAVDQEHHKVITVIKNVPAAYIFRLIHNISKPLSRNVDGRFMILLLELSLVFYLYRTFADYFLERPALEEVG